MHSQSHGLVSLSQLVEVLYAQTVVYPMRMVTRASFSNVVYMTVSIGQG